MRGASVGVVSYHFRRIVSTYPTLCQSQATQMRTRSLSVFFTRFRSRQLHFRCVPRMHSSKYIRHGMKYYFTHCELVYLSILPLTVTFLLGLGSLFGLFYRTLVPQAEWLMDQNVAEELAWFLAVMMVFAEHFMITILSILYSVFVQPQFQRRVFKRVLNAELRKRDRPPLGKRYERQRRVEAGLSPNPNESSSSSEESDDDNGNEQSGKRKKHKKSCCCAPCRCIRDVLCCTLKCCRKRVLPRHWVSWIFSPWFWLRVITLPLLILPLLGHALYGWINGTLHAWDYHQCYFRLKKYTYNQQRSCVQRHSKEYAIFGRHCTWLEMVPILGPIFFFTNTAGAALFAADIEVEEGGPFSLSETPK